MQKIKQWFHHGGISWLILNARYQKDKRANTLRVRLRALPGWMFGGYASWWAGHDISLKLWAGPLELHITWDNFEHERHYLQKPVDNS